MHKIWRVKVFYNFPYIWNLLFKYSYWGTLDSAGNFVTNQLFFYLQLYLESSMPTKQTNLVKPFLQVAFLSLGLLCSLSRIFDYWHHWGDVLVGMFLGTLVAFFIVSVQSQHLSINSYFSPHLLISRRKSGNLFHLTCNRSAFYLLKISSCFGNWDEF